MLKLDVSQLFKARGISQPFTFLRRLGLSSKVAHRILHGETKSIHLKHVFRICVALQCTPNDLVRLDSNTLPNTHPLSKLIPPPAEVDLIHELNGVPLERLSELKQMIDRLKE